MKTKIGKTLSRVLIVLALIAISAMIVWAIAPPDQPTVDGKLDPDNEYNEEGCVDYDENNNPGQEQTGDYSKCYGRYIPDDGFYICNDWYLDPNNYDPNAECDGMNQFDWTDTGFSPNYKYWRIQVHGDSTITVLWKWQGDPNWTEIGNPASNGWLQATGYETSKNDPCTQHPIWELLIPDAEMSGEQILVDIIDPKYVDPCDCPTPDGPAYTPAPSWDSNDFLYWTGGC